MEVCFLVKYGKLSFCLVEETKRITEKRKENFLCLIFENLRSVYNSDGVLVALSYKSAKKDYEIVILQMTSDGFNL